MSEADTAVLKVEVERRREKDETRDTVVNLVEFEADWDILLATVVGLTEQDIAVVGEEGSGPILFKEVGLCGCVVAGAV